MEHRRRILWPAGVLAFLWAVLPVPLPHSSTLPAEEQCLTVSDTAPDPARTDLIAVLARCSARHPTDVEVMAALGRLYESSGQAAEAEALYRRALSVDPGDGDLRLRLGRLLLKRGEVTAARREAAAALTVQPNRRAILELLQDAMAR